MCSILFDFCHLAEHSLRQYQNPSSWTVGRTDERMKWQQYRSASMPHWDDKSSGYISMPKCRPFVCSTQTQSLGWLDGWTNAWNYNNTHRHRCRPRVNHFDTPTCHFLCHSFLVICQQMPRNLDGRTDNNTHQHKSTEGKSSGNISMTNLMPFPPNDLPANMQKPDNMVNERTDVGKTSGRRIFLCLPQLRAGQKMW